MLSIMSINYKFFELSPKELVNLALSNSKYIDGFEISVDYNDVKQKNYMIELASLCKIHNKRFQVHGNSSTTIDEQLKFMNTLYFIYGSVIYFSLNNIS